MIRLACSNIGLPPYDHAGMLPRLASLGVTGLEVAPSRIWRDTWTGLDAAEVTAYRRAADSAGLQIVGLHSLFFDHPEMSVTKGGETLERTIAFTRHLSALCRDLGGRTLVYGGGRRRGDVPPEAARAGLMAYLDAVLPTLESHRTILCFEPLGANDTDFLNTAAECIDLVEAVGHPALGIQLDAKALVDNGEAGAAIFQRVAGRLDHYHANDPGLVVVGSTRAVDHAALGRHLAAISYQGWVSIEQRMLSEDDPLADLAASIAATAASYGDMP